MSAAEDLRCSAKGCTELAGFEVRWNNPRIHDPERRKVWLACPQHRDTLSQFLDRRSFLKEVIALTPTEAEPEEALQPGLIGESELVVGTSDTAVGMGLADVPVLGTSALLVLAEKACTRALYGRLPSGSTSVVTHVELDHLAASHLDARLTAKATLREVDGHRLRFGVVVVEDGREVARGVIHRRVVDWDRFTGNRFTEA